MSTIKELISSVQKTKIATDAGTRMHARLARIFIADTPASDCDNDLVKNIKNAGAAWLFSDTSRVECPIAGYINETFYSMRIDRILVDDTNHEIHILDYKTDIDKTALHDKYNTQLSRYESIMGQIYPTYTIHKYILWTHDWTLEKI